MNRMPLFALLFIISMCSYCSESIDSKKLLHALIDQNHQPTPALLELLEEMETPHAGTFPSIIQATQLWLRPTEKERWEFKNDSIEIKKTRILKLAEKLCLVQKVEPTYTSYKYALLFGGTLDDVRDRLGYLITLWNNGIRFNSLIILTGQRSLDTVLESHELLINNTIENLPPKQTWHFNGKFPTTETEMIKFVFEQTDIPAAWKNLPHVLVDTPPQKTGPHSFRRPNTEDTIVQWLKEYNPSPGSILAISNQPFVGYQNAVLRKNMPQKFTVETVGSCYHDNESITTILDALVRWGYNENQIIHNQQAKY